MTAEAPSSARAHRDPALDGLRGVAILMVYVYHYGGGLKSPHLVMRLCGYVTQMGWTGVTLFFALSGFLITGGLWDTLHARGAHPLHWLRNFYARRALRIFPLYYAVIAGATLLALARGSRIGDLGPFAIYAFFLQNFPFLADRALEQASQMPLYHLWSLAVEEQFYLLWPALLLLAHTRTRALRWTLAIFGVSLLFCAVFYGTPPMAAMAREHLFDGFVLTHAGALALGAAAALAMRGREWTAVEHAAPKALAASLVGFLATGIACRSFLLAARPMFVVALPAAAIAAAALVACTLRRGVWRSVCSNGGLRWLGSISYGFYIFHILLQPLFDRVGLHVAHAPEGAKYQLVRFVVAFPVTAVVSWIVYEIYEVPILRLKKRFPMHGALPG